MRTTACSIKTILRVAAIARSAVLKLALIAGLLWSWPSAQAQDVSSDMRGKGLSLQSAKDDDTWVEIEFLASELVPYAERRPTNQLSFGFQYEATNFKNLLSPIDQQSYEALFGSTTADILQINLGWKVNLPIIGIDLQGVYGNGVASERRDHQLTSLSLSKKGLKVSAILDGIFSDNYLVPYFGIQYVQWDLKMANDFATSSLTTASAMALSAGALIPLHWFDLESALFSYNDGGLNNTYIDLFVNQYQASGNAGDPNLSGTAFGAGFKLEF